MRSDLKKKIDFVVSYLFNSVLYMQIFYFYLFHDFILFYVVFFFDGDSGYIAWRNSCWNSMVSRSHC